MVDRIVSFAPAGIVDIGSAEGYYSLGLARLLPTTPVYSYETNPLSIWQQNRLKRLNSTDNLHIRRYCTGDQLVTHGKMKSAIISDIEGSELELFSPGVIASLGKCLVLIEVHDHKQTALEKVCAILTDRFSPTHDVRSISATRRLVEDWEFQDSGGFSAEEKIELMNEYRSQQQVWLVCEPH